MGLLDSALPPVVATLKADIGDLTAKMGQAQASVNKMSTDTTTSAERMRASVIGHMTAIGAGAMAMGAVFLAAGDKYEASRARLEQAVKNTGGNFDELKGHISGVESKMEDLAFSNSDVDQGLGTLTTALGDSNAAMKFSADVADLARFKHISFADAADMVARLSAGSAKAVKDLGLQVDTTALKHATGADKIALMGQVMEQVHVKVGGQAAAYTHTLGGEIDHLKTVVTDYVERNGKTFGTVLSTAGMAMFGISQVAPIAVGAVSGLSSMFLTLAGDAAVSDAALSTIGTTEAGFVAETEGATAATGGLATSIASVLGPLALLTGGIMLAKTWEDNLKASGDKAAQALITQAGEGAAGIDKLKANLKSLEETYHHQDTSLNPFTYVKADKTEAEIKKVKAAIQDLEKEEQRHTDLVAQNAVGLSGYGRTLYVSGAQVQSFADQLDIANDGTSKSMDSIGKKVQDTQGKLSGAFSKMGLDGNGWANTVLSQNGNVLASDDKLASSVDNVAKAYTGLGPQAQTAGQQLAAMGAQGALSADQLDAVAGEAQKLRDGMASSFGSSTSLVQAFGNQTVVTKDQVNQTLKDMNAEAHHWADDLKAAAAAGIDGGLLAEIAQAGPKAVPLLDGLLADVKAGNLNQINQTVADTNTQLTGAQNTMLSYETPFYVAGQTLGTAGANGVGGGMSGAVDQARNSAISAAQAMAEASQFFANAGAADINAYNYALSVGLSQSTALLAGQMQHDSAAGRYYGTSTPADRPGFAEGGLVTAPTLALIGEAGYPEGVIRPGDPSGTLSILNALGYLQPFASPGALSGGAQVGGGGNTFNMTIVQQPGQDARALARQLWAEFNRLARNNQSGSTRTPLPV